MLSPQQLARQYGFVPQRSAGQNFLVDPKALDKIVAAADLKKTDTVLEIGPGFGVLTEELIRRAGRVVAVELDKRLAAVLQEKFFIGRVLPPAHPVGAPYPPDADSARRRGPRSGVTRSTVIPSQAEGSNAPLTIIQGDALKIDDFGITGPYKLVANIPYNITSALIRKFLEAKNPPELMVLLVQKEVAERACAKPGEMSLLSVGVQYYAKPEIVATVKAGCFWPAPKVDSAILKITPRQKAQVCHPGGSGATDRIHVDSIASLQNDSLHFFELVRAGFSAKRKQLQGNLSQYFKVSHEVAQNWLKSTGLSPKIRAEELGVEDWKRLAKIISIKN